MRANRLAHAALPLCHRLARAAHHPRAQGDKTPDASVRTYADVMREQQLARERDTTLRALAGTLRGTAPLAAAQLLAQCDAIRDGVLPGLGWTLKDGGVKGPLVAPLC